MLITSRFLRTIISSCELGDRARQRNQAEIVNHKGFFLLQIDEIQSKNREIEKLEKMVRESAQINEKLRTKEDETVSFPNVYHRWSVFRYN